MGVAGVTAWRVVTELAQVNDSDRVLVLGASGGVGSIIVSVARRLGATVWGQTGDAAKQTWVRERGAENVVVIGAGGLREAVRELKPTVVFDPLGNGFTGAATDALEESGRLVIFGTSGEATGHI
ncbi:MAG: zinc-binding dehydrogenase, partial [Acidimicrobiales bacterium]